MNLLVSKNQNYVPLTEEICDGAVDQISRLTLDSVREVLTQLVQSQHLNPKEFVAKYLVPHRQEMNHIDLRTHCLMLKVAAGINEELDKLAGMSEGFTKLAVESNEPKVRDKFIQSVALPRVKALTESFDRTNPEIVDKLIRPIPPGLRIEAVVRFIRNLFSC